MATKQTQGKIVLMDFASMTPEVPEYSNKNQHYFLGNVDPFYYLLTGTQEQQYAPLAPAHQMASIVTGLDMSTIYFGTIAMAQDTTVNNILFLTTDNQHTYAITVNNTLLDLGKPSGASSTYSVAGLAIYNGNLIATYGGTSNFYRQLLSSSMTSTGWVTSGGTIFSAGGWLVPFLQNCFTGGSNSSQIQQINSSWSVLPGIDLGTGWGILKAVNWNNKYLAFVGQQNQNNSDKTNYLFLWDGISPKYNYAITIPGVYKALHAHSDGNIYVAVINGGIPQLYVLSGIHLKLVFEFPFTYTSTINWNSWYIIKLISYGKYMAFLMQSEGSGGNSFIMLYDPERKNKYILLSKSFSISANQLTNAISIGDNIYISLADTKIYVYSPISSSVQPIYYQSQNIPLNGTIDTVEIYYDSPPTGTDYINVFINSYDEDTGNTQTALTTINSTSYLNKKKTILNAGIKCNSFNLQLYEQINDNWNGIIRKIVVNYTPNYN
jgi:hypothetical protein